MKTEMTKTLLRKNRQKSPKTLMKMMTTIVMLLMMIGTRLMRKKNGTPTLKNLICLNQRKVLERKGKKRMMILKLKKTMSLKISSMMAVALMTKKMMIFN